MLEVFNSLANAFLRACVGGEIEQALISIGILDDCFAFPIDGQDDRTLDLLELFQEFAGRTAKSGQRFDVACDIDPLPCPSQHRIRC